MILLVLLAGVRLLTVVSGRRLISFSNEDEIVLQFCGSKKSLASGLPIASVLFPGPQLGLILLPLMLFHQIQLIVCAVLARHYGARADRHDSPPQRSEEHTSELQSLMRTSYAVFCLKKKTSTTHSFVTE